MSSRESQRAATPRQVFGAMVRYYREKAGLSRTELARMICKSVSLVEAIESGNRAATPQVTGDLEAALSTDGVLPRLRDEMGNGLSSQVFPSWFVDWAFIEREARILHWFELVVVPGLLQTEGYARALLANRIVSSDDTDEIVAARMERQSILAREEPPELWVVMDEAALHRPVGDGLVMREQLNHLTKAARSTNVVIQVIPAAVGVHEGLPGAGFIIADFTDAPQVAYQDTAVRGQVIEDSDDIGVLIATWDRVRAEALPRKASLELMEEVAESWT